MKKRNETKTGSTPSTPASTSLPKLRVLLVDDDADFHPVFEDAVQPLNKVVTLLPGILSGAEALEQIPKIKPCGYVLKFKGPEEIVYAIHGFMTRHPLVSEPAVWALVDSLNKQSDPPDAKPRLTEMERKVLELLFTGLRRKQVAVELKRAEGTLNAHCRKAFKKLGVHSLPEAKAKLQEQL